MEDPMFSALFKETLAPLALRAALAAIFIFHGWGKIQADWGATWWTKAKQKQTGLPKDVEAKVKQALAEQKQELLDKEFPKLGKGLSGEAREQAKDFEKRLQQLDTDVLSRISQARDKPDEDAPDPLASSAAQMAVAWGELVGGLAMALGLLTRLAGLGLIVIMVGAIFTVTGGTFASTEGGYEFNLAIIAMCTALVFWGAGRLSIDYMFRRKPKTA
jgi:uncharacterized membrane protein YphA (DoxX/SURF4 family)